MNTLTIAFPEPVGPDKAAQIFGQVMHLLGKGHTCDEISAFVRLMSDAHTSSDDLPPCETTN